MKLNKKTVLIGLSGGVDSAVAALLLKKQGFNVVGAFMRNFSENKNKLTGECNWVEDKKDAKKIATILGIKLVTLNFEKEYKKNVINPMFESYSRGLTPNPDALCNKFIKFPLLWNEAKKLNADFIATGHYAKIKRNKEKHFLQIPKDKNKDQTYFLYELKQKDLKHIIFPAGDYTKDEIRNIAKKNKFPNHDKKGSKGICFVGKINMKSFLKQKIAQKKGKVVDVNGNVIGDHPGIMYFTIGERVGEKYGIKIDRKFRDGRIYIIGKNKKKNILIVGDSFLCNSFYIKKLNWINESPGFPLDAKIRIRHLGKLMPAKIFFKDGKYLCMLKFPERNIAEGQSAVIYLGRTVLGGGEIRNAE